MHRKRLRTFALAATLALVGAIGIALAETNIAPATNDHFAWNDEIGWIDFYTPDTVLVTGSKISGYASSSVGLISFDCATSPASPDPNICGTVNYGVCNGPSATHELDGSCTNADASGELSGYAWNDSIGWISMHCKNHDIPTCTTYKVTVDSNGDFQGWAWNDLVGWISFNCANVGGSCATTPYKVNTSWRATSSVAFVDSAVIDSRAQGGVVLNSLIWQGTLPAETFVDFQIATSSTSTGPWAFVGPGGDTSSYFGLSCAASFVGGSSPTGAAPNTPICVNPSAAQGRYLRYRIRLRSNLLQTVTPQIDDIILNWSR